MKPAATYYRVSTERQGQSGLGLDAQQKAVKDFAKTNKFRLVHEFTEIETGKRNNRPVLQEALVFCKKNKATLLIAKLDRLGRNVAFIAALMESEVDFIAVDNPHANKLIVHIMAAFAEHERDLISQRTKDALQMAKKRGVELGAFGKTVLSKKNKKASQLFARKMKPLIRKLEKEGYTTIREITERLNVLKTPTYSGKGKWHLNTVHRLLKEVKRKN